MSISTDTLLLLLGITLMYSTPMIFAAQGSVISEVSGVVNIGIEGMMTIGAFTGAAIGYFSGSPWLGFICAGLAGAVFGLIHAFASVTCKADQTVCGIAMNLIDPARRQQDSQAVWKPRSSGLSQQPECGRDHGSGAGCIDHHVVHLLQNDMGPAHSCGR